MRRAVCLACIACLRFLPLAAEDIAYGGRQLDAHLFLPAGEAKGSVLLLGGSDGGYPDAFAEAFQGSGFALLSLAYCKTEHTPPSLEEIPLEYFRAAISWLEKRTGEEGVVVLGYSKGGELALLLASRFPDIKGVIAIAPSDVVWQGIAASYFPLPKPRSSWSEGGAALPYVPFDYSYYLLKPFGRKYRDLYSRSLENRKAVDAATIRVEDMRGPVLLLSAGEDETWPSERMCARIMERLGAHGYAYPYEGVDYRGAGHEFPIFSEGAKRPSKTEEADRIAHAEYQRKVMDFMKYFAPKENARHR